MTIASLSPQASICSWTEAGPSNAWHTELQSRTPTRGALYVPDAPNNREGPHTREPSKCLNREAMEKDWPKRNSDRQLQDAWKNWDKAVCDPAHFALRHLHAQLSRRQSCHRKKKSCLYVLRVTSVMSNSLRPCRLWPARLLSQGASPGKNTGVYRPILVAILFFFYYYY